MDTLKPGQGHGVHDRFFRGSFSELQVAQPFCRKVLSPELVASLSWPSLRVEPGSFVNEQLRSQFSDILYSIQIRKARVHLYFLMEHLSRAQPLARLRVFEYLAQTWRHWLKQQRARKRSVVLLQ